MARHLDSVVNKLHSANLNHNRIQVDLEQVLSTRRAQEVSEPMLAVLLAAPEDCSEVDNRITKIPRLANQRSQPVFSEILNSSHRTMLSVEVEPSVNNRNNHRTLQLSEDNSRCKASLACKQLGDLHTPIPRIFHSRLTQFSSHTRS